MLRTGALPTQRPYGGPKWGSKEGGPNRIKDNGILGEVPGFPEAEIFLDAYPKEREGGRLWPLRGEVSNDIIE